MPFPKYNTTKPLHQRLATLGWDAETKTAAFLPTVDTTSISSTKLGTLRLDVRRRLNQEMSAIDAVVEQISEV